MPIVSVIIPTYNRKAYVQEAIDSVLAQTCKNYEIIVIDDGSTDGTGEALQAKYGGRIQYVWQENQGESVARNKGIRIAAGEYIALLDSDDLWEPHKLEVQIPVLDQNSNIILVLNSNWLLDSRGNLMNSEPAGYKLKEDDFKIAGLLVKNTLGSAASSVLIRKSALDIAGCFDETIRYGEDWDLWIRLRKLGDFAYINEPLAYIRQHTESQWHSQDPEVIDQRLASQLGILEKNASLFSEEFSNDLKNKAVAHQYVQSAILEYSIRRHDSGLAKLKKALDTYHDKNEVGSIILRGLLSKAITQSNMNDEPSCAYLDQIAESIDSFKNLLSISRKKRRQMIAQAAAEMMFHYYKLDNPKATRYFLVKTLVQDPSWIKNKAMLKILVKSVTTKFRMKEISSIL